MKKSFLLFATAALLVGCDQGTMNEPAGSQPESRPSERESAQPSKPLESSTNGAATNQNQSSGATTNP